MIRTLTYSAEVIPNTNPRNTKTTEFNVGVHITQHIVSANNNTKHEEIKRDIVYKLPIQEVSS